MRLLRNAVIWITAAIIGVLLYRATPALGLDASLSGLLIGVLLAALFGFASLLTFGRTGPVSPPDAG